MGDRSTTAPSSKRVSVGRVGRGSGTTSRTNQVGQRKDTAEEKHLPVPVLKPSKFLRHSFMDPFVIFPRQEDQYLIHEIVDYARKFYWHALAPTQHPSAAPHSGPIFYAHMGSSKMAPMPICKFLLTSLQYYGICKLAWERCSLRSHPSVVPRAIRVA
jgi:hypothetical protein